MRRLLAFAFVFSATGVSVAAFVAVERRGWFAAGSVYDQLATALLLASVVVGFGCAAALWLLRRTFTAVVLILLALAVGVWAIAIASHGPTAGYATLSVIAFRPLMFWAVIAWPTGRPSRAERRSLIMYAAALTACWASWVSFDEQGFSAGQAFDNHLSLLDAPKLSAALNAFGNNVVLPTGSVVVLVALVRRFRRLPTAARKLMSLALVAGILAALGDILLLLIDRYLSEFTGNGSGRTMLGGFVAIVDQGRFVFVPLLLVAAAMQARCQAPSTKLRSVEIGPATSRLQDNVAAALGDPSAVVAYHRQPGGWFTVDGAPVALGGSGRRVTIIERAGVPLAAIEHDAAFDDRPTTVEVAVAAAASAIEYEQLAALASVRLHEVQNARRLIVDVEQSTRTTLERNLHDGAQQRLVGLALQASLADRTRDGDSSVLIGGVDEALSELADLAAGVLPAILAERGLSAALGALAVTTPLAVEVQVSLPQALPQSIAATAWFIVAEAIANTIKHAEATTIRIQGTVADGVLRVAIIDDGIGGASLTAGSGLRSLDARARELSGQLMVTSPVGGGTSITVEIPVAA